MIVPLVWQSARGVSRDQGTTVLSAVHTILSDVYDTCFVLKMEVYVKTHLMP